MNIEIERKFLIQHEMETILNDLAFSQGKVVSEQRIIQHYLKDTGNWAIRVRSITDISRGCGVVNGTHYVKTMKLSVSTESAIEMEHPITEDEFNFLAKRPDLTYPGLDKRRTSIMFDGSSLVWELDEFSNPELQWLKFVEVELDYPDQTFKKPIWIGKEVTCDKNYRNVVLCKRLNERRTV